MDGEPIRSEGDVDPAAVDDLAERMAVIPGRRAPVRDRAASLAWIAVAAVVAVALGARAQDGGRPGWRSAFAYLPLLLLAGAAIEPGGLGGGPARRLRVRLRWRR